MLTSARQQTENVATASRRRGTLDQVLINAAMDLFASYGYRGTSLARIARAAGVTKGALYWHFADKEEFFIAVVARVLGEWEPIFEKSAHASNPVEFRAEFGRMFDTLAELNQNNPWVSRLLLIIALESHKIGPRVLRSIPIGLRPRSFRATWVWRCSGICTVRVSTCAVRFADRRASS